MSGPSPWKLSAAAAFVLLLSIPAFSCLSGAPGARTERRVDPRDEWIRFTLGGDIPPGAYSRALAQRRALLRERRGGVGSESIAPLNAALPTSPSGWTNLTGYVHPVGRINDLLIHPTSTNTMWAGADGGGIWKTTDGGTTWQPINDFLGSLSISSFAMRPGDPSTIYAGTGAMGSHTGLPGDGVFKSTDGGTTFNQLTATDPGSNSDWQHVYQLAIHPSDSNTVIAATDGGAYITINGGTSWTKIAAASTRARNVSIHPANSNLRVIAMDDGTVKIAVDGSTYNSYTIATTTGSTYTRVALAPSNQNVMYALVWQPGSTQLYRSSTGGTSWSVVPPPSNTLKGQLFYTGGLWVDPTNENHIAVAEFWAAVTTDASVASPTWTTLCCGWVDFHGVIGSPGYNGSTNKIVFFADDGGLYRWTDVDTVGGTSPSYLSPNGLVATEAYSVAGRGGNVVFGAQDVSDRFYTTTISDPTQKWQFVTMSYSGFTRIFGDGATAAADRTNPNILYGSLQYLTLQRSLDGGTTAELICQQITDVLCNEVTKQVEGGSAAFIAPFVLDPNNQSRMLAGAATLWRSNNVSSGSPPTFTQIQTGVGSNVSAIAIAPSNSDVVWVAYQNGNVYKTANGTATTPTWTQVTNVPSGSKLRIYIDRTDANHVFIGLAGFLANRLVTTPDGGTTWSNVAGLPSASVYAIQQHPSNSSWLYVGTAVGLFASEDGGSTWSTTNQGPANVQVRDLNWYSDVPAVLLVATFGRGIWRASVNPIAAPASLNAMATATNNVALSWAGVTGATTYKIYRSSSYPTFTQIVNTMSTATTYNDGTVSPGVAYLYTVRASDGSTDSVDSNADLATTIMFTDPTLTAGSTSVRALHISELRTAVIAVETLAGPPGGAFTDSTLSSAITIKALHLTELRSRLDTARSTLHLPAMSYTDPSLSTGTIIRAAHINDLRGGVQ